MDANNSRSCASIRGFCLRQALIVQPEQGDRAFNIFLALDIQADPAGGEMLAQDIIARMDLRQSSISRHLKMLVATGLVLERRAEGANKRYRIDPARVEWIWTALRRVLAGQPAPQATARDEQAPELRRFLDAQGRVIIWPARQRDRDLVLDYLASHFEPGREYNEPEVNEVFRRWDSSLDPATLRRYMFDTRRLARTADGRRYGVPERE